MDQAPELIQGRKYAPVHLGNVAVLGLGVSGKAVVRYLLLELGRRVSSLTMYAGPATEAARAFCSECSQAGAQVVFDSEDVTGSFDVVIASPGISQFGPFYESAAAHSREVISEVEFAWRESAEEARWLAITGTNGKTTTTSLAAHLLAGADFSAAAVGNIGDTCIEAVASDAVDLYVAEVSSYQLASTSRFAPDCAVLLNITPDHLAWHGSFDAYVQAKAKIFANLGRDGTAVIDATNSHARTFARDLRDQGRCRVVPIGTKAGIGGDMRVSCGSSSAAFVRDDGMLVVAIDGNEVDLVPSSDLLIEGQHNQSNALVAASAALALGASVDAVRAGLRSFEPLEHRLEPCGSLNGAACYNDSKATNVDATLVALRAFAGKHPIVLLGGDDKGTSLDDLVAAAQETCKLVVCFGAAGPRFFEAFEGSRVTHLLASNLANALDTARAEASRGDVILLSPACASFDEFDSFEHRGRVFKQLVKERQG